MDDYLEQGYADALKEFPKLAVHDGTADYERVLYLAMGLIDGDIPGEIEMDLEEIYDLAKWATGAEWIEHEHGGARYAGHD